MSSRTIPRIDNEVKCPICGFELVHPVAVKVEPVCGDMGVYVNHDGLHTFVSRAAEHIRGIRITTSFLCEETHLWDEVRTFHKGLTTQTIERGPDWTDMECAPTTIWRD